MPENSTFLSSLFQQSVTKKTADPKISGLWAGFVPPESRGLKTYLSAPLSGHAGRRQSAGFVGGKFVQTISR
jgi:hypothetical protein